MPDRKGSNKPFTGNPAFCKYSQHANRQTKTYKKCDTSVQLNDF